MPPIDGIGSRPPGLDMVSAQQTTAQCDSLEARLDALGPEAKAVFDKLQGMGMSLNEAVDKCRQSDPASLPPVLSALATLQGKDPSQWAEKDKALMLSAAKVTILEAKIKDIGAAMKASPAPETLKSLLVGQKLIMQQRDVEMIKLSQLQRATIIDRI